MDTTAAPRLAMPPSTTPAAAAPPRRGPLTELSARAHSGPPQCASSVASSSRVTKDTWCATHLGAGTTLRELDEQENVATMHHR